jgi:hypothetical protein
MWLTFHVDEIAKVAILKNWKKEGIGGRCPNFSFSIIPYFLLTTPSPSL